MLAGNLRAGTEQRLKKKRKNTMVGRRGVGSLRVVATVSYHILLSHNSTDGALARNHLKPQLSGEVTICPDSVENSEGAVDVQYRHRWK